MLCNDIYNYVILFLDNINDIISWKLVCKSNYEREVTANFIVLKFYKNIKTPMMKLSNPFYSNIQIKKFGHYIHTLYADRLMENIHFKYMYNIVELHCKYAKLTDVVFKYLPNLKKLYCDHCNEFTDLGLLNTRLEVLDCGYWNSLFTDVGLLNLQHTLMQLYCRYNVNFTDESLKKLLKLEILYVNNNTNFTDKSLLNLRNIHTLYCGKNNNFTDYGFINLKKLTVLSCDRNTNITDNALQFIPNVKVLFTYSNNNISNEGLKYLPNLTILNCKSNTNIDSSCLVYLTKLQDLTCSFVLPNYNILKSNNPYLVYINSNYSRTIEILTNID